MRHRNSSNVSHHALPLPVQITELRAQRYNISNNRHHRRTEPCCVYAFRNIPERPKHLHLFGERAQTFSHILKLRGGVCEIENRTTDQRVMHHRGRSPQCLCTCQRQETGVAGSRANQIDKTFHAQAARWTGPVIDVISSRTPCPCTTNSGYTMSRGVRLVSRTNARRFSVRRIRRMRVCRGVPAAHSFFFHPFQFLLQHDSRFLPLF